MRQAAIKFISAVFVLTIVCAIFQIGWNSQVGVKWQIDNIGFILLGIFAVSTIGIHLFLLNSAKNSPQAFVRGFMASTALKFMFYLLVLIVFLLYSSANKQALILHFLFYYLVFTVLEISSLYKEIGKPHPALPKGEGSKANTK